MVPWDIRTMAKEKDYLGLIDVETQGNILATTKVVRCVEGSSPSKVLMVHMLLMTQNVGKVKGQTSLWLWTYLGFPSFPYIIYIIFSLFKIECLQFTQFQGITSREPLDVVFFATTCEMKV